MHIGKLLFCCAAVLAAGCRPEITAPRTEMPFDPRWQEEITNAQPKLPPIRLFVGPAEMQAEVASQPHEVRAGLMFRTHMAENEGMLFVFPEPHRASFWMKNTKIPLSVAYMDPSGVIRQIFDMQPDTTNSHKADSSDIQFVLEANKGWFERNRIGPGTLVRTPAGSLQETFFSGPPPSRNAP